MGKNILELYEWEEHFSVVEMGETILEQNKILELSERWQLSRAE